MSIPVEPAIAPRVVVSGSPSANEATGVRRVVLALALAAFALLAAGVAALGPAREHRDLYTWPPSDRAAAVDGARYAPLLLTRHRPDRLRATTPCTGLAEAVAAGGEAPLTLIATSRRPDGVNGRGLLVTMERTTLVTRLGGRELLRTPWPGPQDTGADCALVVEFHGADWRVTSGGRVVGSGRERAPNVSGLYTDLPSSAGLRAALDTGVVESSPSTRQWLLNGVAIAAAGAALVLLLRSRGRTRSAGAARYGLATLARAISWVDVAVVGVLFVWWVVGPAFFDDGWVMATVLNTPASHSFSVYYDHFGIAFPFVFLPLVVLYGASRVSTSLLWLRLPILLVGVATWGMLRAYVAHLLRPGGRRTSLAVVTLAAVFLVGWFSWLGTLRPEPVVAALAALVILAVRRFQHSGRLGDIAVAAIAAAVAVSVHPEGIVAIAPLAVATPALYAWSRARRWERWFALAAVGLAAGAVLVFLVFVHTDLTFFRDSRNVFASDTTHGYSWHDELQRYVYLLSDSPYGTVARRASGLLALVPFALFLTRPDRRRNPDLDLPILSLMLGVVALAFTPSKWPWQFGALVPFAALAAAAEVHRLLIEPPGVSRVRRLLLAVAGTAFVSVIAWRGNAFWAPLVPVAQTFGRGGSEIARVDFSSEGAWVALVLGSLVTAGAVALLRTRRSQLSLAWRLERALTWVGGGALAASATLVVALTLALFVADGFVAPSWSLGRQNIDSVTGSTCGLGDDLAVVDPAEGRELPIDAAPAGEDADGAVLAALPGRSVVTTHDGGPAGTASAPGLGPHWDSRIHGDSAAAFASPWFMFDQSSLRGAAPQRLVALGAGLGRAGDDLVVQFGRQAAPGVASVAVEKVPPPERSTKPSSKWRPVLLDSVLIPPDADRVRLLGAAGTSENGWLGFGTPRLAPLRPLTTLVAPPTTLTLAAPWIRTYFPCITQPRVESGRAQAPDFVIGDAISANYPQSPMRFVGDLYPLSQLVVLRDGKTMTDFSVDRVEKHLVPGFRVSAEVHHE
jgi:hypothetical protein